MQLRCRIPNLVNRPIFSWNNSLFGFFEVNTKINTDTVYKGLGYDLMFVILIKCILGEENCNIMY